MRLSLERVGLSAPRTLTVAITGTCNLQCLHCLVESGPRPATRHVPLEAVRRLVADFAALGGEALVLTGGEPLSHPHWRDILRACVQEPSLRSVGIQTNGSLLGERQVGTLETLAFDGLSIQISLDGGTARTHDAVRGEGSFARTLAGIGRLVKAGLGPRVTIAFTEMRHNMEDIPVLLELVDSLGLRALVGGTLMKDGRALEGGVAPPTPEQYEALLARYHSDSGFQELYRRYGRIAAIEWWQGRHGGHTPCCTFVEHPYVAAEGRIYPCAVCHVESFGIDGVFERPLREVLEEGAPRWAVLADTNRQRTGQLPSCQGCIGQLHCAGGCMGRAHAACGTFLAVEDRCELRKAVYRWTAS